MISCPRPPPASTGTRCRRPSSRTASTLSTSRPPKTNLRKFTFKTALRWKPCIEFKLTDWRLARLWFLWTGSCPRRWNEPPKLRCEYMRTTWISKTVRPASSKAVSGFWSTLGILVHRKLPQIQSRACRERERKVRSRKTKERLAAL